MATTVRRLVIILGVPVDDLTLEEALARLVTFVEVGRATGKCHQVVTINADFVKNALHDPELRYLLQDADLATPDGMPLVWGARLLKVPLHGRISGADLVPLLAEQASERGYSIFFLGASPGVAATAAANLKRRFPALKVAGVLSPQPGTVLDMDPSIGEAVRAAQPDILLVAFGNPKQEKWIGMHRQQLGVPVMIGVGGTLDFLAGHTRRAPRWMQESGLEWLYRLAMEPGRLWRRYIGDLMTFGPFFAYQWWRMVRGGAVANSLPATNVVFADRTAVVRVVGSLTIANYQPFNEAVSQALERTPYVVIDLGGTQFLDSAAIGSLVHFARRAREAGGELVLAAPPATIRSTLTMLRLNAFLTAYPTLDRALAGVGPTTRISPVAASPSSLPAPAPMPSKWAVVKAQRRLDAMAAPALAQQCSAMLLERRFLVLDLSETTILTSAGLAVLAQLHRLAQEKQGALRVTNCSKEVMQVIEMVRFDKVLALYHDLATATA